ncbi:MAG: hypothetical protein M5U01_14995 [Ardenticatenaceae bacterium]|nr:hypothetical protein [Ardenticatenaceae bacterium]
MTITSTTTIDRINTVSAQAHVYRIRNAAGQVVRFVLHLLEMTLAMMAGMAILYVLDVLTPDSASYSEAFEYGTNLFDLTMGVFMTVPMVAWMRVRGHGWRHGAEMAFAMFAPVAAIVVLRLLGADAEQPWLADASHPAMFLGMIIAMLYRRDHYTGKAGHSAHATHSELS